MDVNLTGYDIYQKAPSDPDYVKVNQGLVTAAQYIVVGLASATFYEFAVTAVYNDGIASGLSNPASCTTG